MAQIYKTVGFLMKFYRKIMRGSRYEEWEEIWLSKFSGVVQNINGSVCYYLGGDLHNAKGPAIHNFLNQKYYYFHYQEIKEVVSNKEYRKYIKLLSFL